MPRRLRERASSPMSACPEEKTEPGPGIQMRAVRPLRLGSDAMPSRKKPSRVRMRTRETGMPIRFAIPQSSGLGATQSPLTLDAGLHALAVYSAHPLRRSSNEASWRGGQAHPLEVRVFSLGFGKIVMTAEELPLPGHDGPLAADRARSHTFLRITNMFELRIWDVSYSSRCLFVSLVHYSYIGVELFRNS